MKTKVLMSLTSFFVATSFLTQPVFAGQVCDLERDKCSSSELSEDQKDKTLYLSDLVNKTLEDLYQKNLAEGKDTKVVLIARRGQNTKKFKILKDADGKEDIKTLIARLQAESKIVFDEREKYSDGTPRSYYGQIEHEVFKKNFNNDDKLKYSHFGIAFRNDAMESTETPGKMNTGPGTGKWTFYHLLYSCDPPFTRAETEALHKLKAAGDKEGFEKYLADKKERDKSYIKKSHIFRGTVPNFFYEQLHSYEAQIVVPTQEIQNSLEDILLKKRQAYSFQQNHYNAVAKFDDLTQQNSNQFVLEALAAAMRPEGQVMSRAAAIKVLQETGYSASKITPTGWTAVLGIGWIQNLVSHNMPTMCLKTQPDLEKKVAEIVTSNSVVNWMKRNNLLDTIIEVGLPGELQDDLEDINSIIKRDAREEARSHKSHRPKS